MWGPGPFACHRYHCPQLSELALSPTWRGPSPPATSPCFIPSLGTKFWFPFHCCLFVHSFVGACVHSFVIHAHSFILRRSDTGSDEAGVEPPTPSCGSVGRLVHLCFLLSENTGLVLFLMCPADGHCDVTCLCPSLPNLLRHRVESDVARVPGLAGLGFLPHFSLLTVCRRLPAVLRGPPGPLAMDHPCCSELPFPAALLGPCSP